MFRLINDMMIYNLLNLKLMAYYAVTPRHSLQILHSHLYLHIPENIN